MDHQQRLDIQEVSPAAHEAIFPIEKYVRSGRLEPTLRELVKIRASQINGCAYCLDMHTSDALKRGESQRRIFVLSAWHEAGDIFTPREQAALALTEEVTEISLAGVSDETWENAATQFDQQELAELLMAIAAINVWNRLSVATNKALPAEPASSEHA